MSVSPEQIHKAFEYAKKTYANEMSASEAAKYLANHYKLKESTAYAFVYAFLKMMSGQVYKRGLSVYATNYFLEGISADFGADKLQNALSALMQHIIYYEDGHKTNMHKLRGVHRSLTKEIASM
ncbi:hypothetical protein [Hymenobacter psychrotolerans]|uniref:hypothetical protein n=1 Tax=Hymenobacter psychrotolerans TaxID=344998 RepID=UPI000933E895|nr:hypothetical protein [Hymenobacter psychrotolerans]